MASRYYPIYQVVGWFLLYASLMLSLRQTFGFNSLEYIFGAVLVGATALWSHLMRVGYHKAAKDKPLGWQLGYFLPMAILGGALAATIRRSCAAKSQCAASEIKCRAENLHQRPRPMLFCPS